MPTPTPAILLWARETAGLSVEEAATKLAIRPKRGVSATERMARIEAGLEEVGRPLLLRMTKVYRRPLLTFYLEEPPARGHRGEDFRSIPERRPEIEPLVDALVRDIRARQSMVRTLLEDEEETAPLRFIGSANYEDGVRPVLDAIRRFIGVDHRILRRESSPEAAFTRLRTAVEAAGVFVLLVGNLGSHHTALDTSAFRGFALADPLAPFIVINDRDAKSAWSFTLLHELAHLWLGRSGISGSYPEGQLERFCNDVASQFLLADDELTLAGVNRRTDIAQAISQIGQFADVRRLSRAMVAYRLFRADIITEQTWQTLTRRFHDEWSRSRAEPRESEGDGEGGPSYYVVRRHRLGQALLRLVARTLSDGLLTPTKAGKVLGVRPRSVMPLLSTVSAQAS
jgi:Zn-dependent peptidase ImmA (M78 family)